MLLRTVFYTVGVAIVLVLEKVIESRHAYDGLIGAMQQVLSHPDMNHVWAAAISVGVGMFLYNFYSVLSKQLGAEKLTELMFKRVR